MPFNQESIEHIRAIQIKATRRVNDLFGGMYRSVFKGRGLEFEDVREYQAGDEIRSIDWNVTARMQNPYVKNYREERELTVMLVVDISASSKYGHASRSKSELIAEIGALLAFSAIKNQDKVGLLLFSEKIELFLKPKKGLKHILRIIRELLFFKPQHLGTNLQHALAFLRKVQRHQSICFLISDFIANDFEHELQLTAQRHETIAIQIYDEYEKQLPKLGLVRLRDLETQKYLFVDTTHPTFQSNFQESSKQNNKQLRKVMSKAGVDFISINTQEAYLKTLYHFFRKRGCKR